MKTKTDINSLATEDIYSLMMFVLYQSSKDKDLSTVCELPFILDKDNLLNLCEYFGGTTIKVPTVEELLNLINALSIYQSVYILGDKQEDVEKRLNLTALELRRVRETLQKVITTLGSFSFTRRNDD